MTPDEKFKFIAFGMTITTLSLLAGAMFSKTWWVQKHGDMDTEQERTLLNHGNEHVLDLWHDVRCHKAVCQDAVFAPRNDDHMVWLTVVRLVGTLVLIFITGSFLIQAVAILKSGDWKLLRWMALSFLAVAAVLDYIVALVMAGEYMHMSRKWQTGWRLGNLPTHALRFQTIPLALTFLSSITCILSATLLVIHPMIARKTEQPMVARNTRQPMVARNTEL